MENRNPLVPVVVGILFFIGSIALSSTPSGATSAIVVAIGGLEVVLVGVGILIANTINTKSTATYGVRKINVFMLAENASYPDPGLMQKAIEYLAKKATHGIASAHIEKDSNGMPRVMQLDVNIHIYTTTTLVQEAVASLQKEEEFSKIYSDRWQEL